MTARPRTGAAQAAGRRGSRARVLLVIPEEQPQATAIGDGPADQLVVVHHAFHAVGELANAPAQQPFELILLAESAVNGFDDPAGALRRVDPAVRIYLVKQDGGARASQNGHAKLGEASFDGVLDDWPGGEALRRLLRGETQDEGVIGAAAQRGHVDQVEQPHRAAEQVDPGESVSQAAARTSRQDTAAAPTHAASHAAQTGQELGDIDLVEAVMRSARGEVHAVRDVALRLIRQHTGWSDVAVVEATSGEAGSSEAVMRCGDQERGVLQSRLAPAGELARWADWLARWLALEAEHIKWRELAERDELTGAFNRRYFMSFLADAMKHAAKKRLPIAVMVFDLDNFKQYNDQFGHAAGDEILRETVRLLNSVIRKSDRVCRIGGDEFAVVFTDPGGPRERGSAPPETAEVLAQRFQDQVCQMRFPKLGIEAPGTLSVSAGLATFPWDGWDPEALLHHADALALQSKRKGKNALTLGRGARQECGEEG